MFQLQKDRLKIREKFGKGRFGTVFPYQKHSEDLKWVVKRTKAEDPDALISLLPEVILGMSCDHPNIVPIKGYFIEKISNDEGFNIYTKLPRMKGTLLEDYKERKGNNKVYSEEEIIRHFYSLVCGIEYLHKKKIFHGDLKPESLLLDQDKSLKIGDIGIAKYAEEVPLVNYQYSAPEVLGIDIKKEMLRKADIWSLGVVILELCCFEMKLLNASLPKDKLQERLNELFAGIQGKYQNIIMSLLLRILSLDPQQRPDIGVIKNELEHNYPEILGVNNQNPQNQAQNPGNIAISDEQKQEIFGRYEAEIKQLKEVLSQFESELSRKACDFEERLRKSEEERARINKDCEESLMTEFEKRMQLHEKLKVLEDQIDRLQAEKKGVVVQVVQKEKAKKESAKEDYENNLQKVVSQLNGKWNKWYKLAAFECKVDGHVLQIKSSIKYPIKDKDLILLLKDLIPTLEENNLLNLYGINFLIVMSDVTDKSIAEFVAILSHESLKFAYLVLSFIECKKLTDQSFEELSKVITVRAPRLQHLDLTFDKCTGLTDKSLVSIARGLSNPSLNLDFLELNFEDVKGMTDSGFDSLIRTIEERNRRSQSMSTLNLTFKGSNVRAEKKMQAKRIFENLASLDIN